VKPFEIYLLVVASIFGAWKALELLEQLPHWAAMLCLFVYLAGAIAAAHFEDIQHFLRRSRS
jgi:hypothetical protein